MNKQIVTYSLLAHIYNSGVISSNLEDIFIPIVKSGLAKMSASGKFKGEELAEITEFVNSDTGLEMPDPILRRILEKIEKEVNTPQKTRAKFHLDGSFIIEEYVFDEYYEEQTKKENEILTLEKIYHDFLLEEAINLPNSSIYTFIEEGKYSLGKYINKKYPNKTDDNTVEARFVNFIRSVPGLYRILQSVYIGSILSTYLEYEPKNLVKGVELVLDTNFVISLLDLNTSGSTVNCKKLLELGDKLGYKHTVLDITLREIDQLLKVKVDMFDSTFFSRLVDPEDIYNACHRRNLTKMDLEKIRQSVQDLLEKENVVIISNVEKYENIAKFSEDYEKLKDVRHTQFAALHDATCLAYVKDKRKRNVYEFSKVNCWFVNNSSRRRSINFSNGHQPFMIKAEDLLNMLWLSSPIVKNALGVGEMANIGLFRLVSSTLNDALPHGTIIKELEDNIRRYAKEEIRDEDVVYISKSIAIRSFTDLEDLNKVAKEDEKEFVEKLRQIVDKQKEKDANQQQLIDTIVASFKQKNDELELERKTIDGDRAKLSDLVGTNVELAEALARQRKENILLRNGQIQEKRDKYLKRRKILWRASQWLYFGLSIFVPIFIYFIIIWVTPADADVANKTLAYCRTNWALGFIITGVYALFPGFIIAGLAQKYFNESGIAKYEERIKYPKDLELLKDDNF